MTETLSKVYDIVYPSPITLKEISSIVTVVNLWRHEIIKYLESKPSKKFHRHEWPFATIRCLNNRVSNEFHLTKRIRLERVIPGMPSTIYDSLREYINTFRNSLHKWLHHHSNYVFQGVSYDNENLNYVLSNFYDFVLDWNGTIDYVRTAKLMLQCDRFSADEKYRIACLYCFEDDIKRVWPFVSARLRCGSLSFYKFPHLTYWTCNLGNTPHHYDDDVDRYFLLWLRESVPDYTDEEIIVTGGFDNRSALEYFWRRIPAKNHLKIAIQIFERSTNLELFARSILSQLSGRRLRKFANTIGEALISRLLLDDFKPDCALATWMYIRNTIKAYSFHRLVMELLLANRNAVFVQGQTINLAYVCCEIWNTAPQHLKQSVFDNLLFEDSLFPMVRKHRSQRDLKDMTFLIAILHDASFEQRNAFWHNNWRNLLCGPRVEDLLGIMKLCFRDDYEMTLFKETTMAIGLYENIKEYCDWLLKDRCFETFHKFVSFCCPDTLNKRELKMRLVRSSYLRENYSTPYIFWQDHKSTNEFIDDVFETVDLRVEFKNQLISLPAIFYSLWERIELGDFSFVIEFVDAFTSDEGVAVAPLKKRLFDHFKQHMISPKIKYTSSEHIQKLLIWLLGSKGEVAKFKQSLLADDVFHTVMRVELEDSASDGDEVFSAFLENFDHFLMWYFDKGKKKLIHLRNNLA